jgi:hypothetical protein
VQSARELLLLPEQLVVKGWRAGLSWSRVGTGLVLGLTTVTGVEAPNATSTGVENIVRAASAAGARILRGGNAVSLGMNDLHVLMLCFGKRVDREATQK